MKRTDNLDLAQELLDHCMYAVLSVSEPDGTPYGVPISPARSGDNLYFHCGLTGRKVDALRANPRVSLSCVGDTQVVPGKFNIHFQSAIVSGTAQEIADREEKRKALRLISQKYCPEDMATFQRTAEKGLSGTGIWKIAIESVTTKG